jgi:hypothetical protein
MNRQLLNSSDELVLDAIEGLVACNAHLQRLDGFPEVRAAP